VQDQLREVLEENKKLLRERPDNYLLAKAAFKKASETGSPHHSRQG
jgi:hypothetical protein